MANLSRGVSSLTRRRPPPVEKSAVGISSAVHLVLPVGEHAGDLVAVRRDSPGAEVFDELVVVAYGIEVDGELAGGPHDACSTGMVRAGQMAYMRVELEMDQAEVGRHPRNDRTARKRPVASRRTSSLGFA